MNCKINIKNILFLLLLFLSFQTESFGEDLNLRRCLLLPILDQVDGAIGYKVFEEIEETLKNSRWCYYHSNSEVMNILSNYKSNLKEYLNDPKILRLLAEKTQTGSLIKIDLVNSLKGIEVNVKVVGNNGEDLFYSEKEYVETQDISQVVQAIRLHLQRYSKTIPYHAEVLGVLGKQITIDMGSNSNVKIGLKYSIKRKIRKIEHPLLKRIMTFETEEVARGEVVSVSENQAVGIISVEENTKKVRAHDWIIFDFKDTDESFEKEVKYPQIKGHEFGKLGTVGFGFVLGTGDNSTYNAGVNRSIGGMIIGLDGHLEVWATRNYWLRFEMEKDFANYKKQMETVSRDENEVNLSVYKLIAGYRYLPLDFFYGPQIDGYFGYGKYSYDSDTVVADGMSSSTFSGLMIGTTGSMPVYHEFRVYLRADLIFRPGYYEDIKIHGEKSASSSYYFEVGGTYDFDVRMQIKAALSRTSNEAKFENPDAEVRYQETRLKVGAIFTF